MEKPNPWFKRTCTFLVVAWRVIILLCVLYVTMVVSDELQPPDYFKRPLW